MVVGYPMVEVVDQDMVDDHPLVGVAGREQQHKMETVHYVEGDIHPLEIVVVGMVALYKISL